MRGRSCDLALGGSWSHGSGGRMAELPSSKPLGHPSSCWRRAELPAHLTPLSRPGADPSQASESGSDKSWLRPAQGPGEEVVG